jgi:AAA+ superfamily predicted ATPase
MACKRVLSSKCSSGHSQSWQCHKGKPASCRACESEKKAKEKQLQDELVRKQKREAEQQEHAKQMAILDEELRIIREAAADAQIAQEMKLSLLQRKKDLEDAKKIVARASNLSTNVNGNATPSNGETSYQKQPNPAAPPTLYANFKASSKSNNGEINSEQQSGPAAEPVSNNTTKDTVTPPEAKPKPSPSELEWDRQKRVENVFNEAVDSLMQMTGLEEVKTQFLKIKARIDTDIRRNTNMKDERFGVVMQGNPGTGKTTVARLYAKFLASIGVLPGTEFVETTGSSLASDGVPRAKQLIETLLKAGGGCLFLDEAYQLASGNSYGGAAVLDFLLAEIENQTGKIVFILAGYNKQMEKFFEHNPGFTSRIPFQLQFADYSDQALLLMLSRRIQKKYKGNMKVEGGVMGLYSRIAIRRLGRGRGREGFGNARALENMLAKVAERQADRLQRERSLGAQPDDFLLKKEDLIGPEPSQAITDSAAWKELQSMIGLKAVKGSLQGLLDRISLNYQRELAEKPPVEVSLNRACIGSPGTGKTSVGKLYGQILADMGILSNGEVVVKNPADFVGSVLGESEKNTKAILKATEGKVLVIDEAYMLSSGVTGLSTTSDPYKTAVVDTIVAEVQSTLGEDRCVLLLGYKEQMEQWFQNTNPGLARRFPLDDAFVFEDFDNDQLRAILEMKLKKQGLDATQEAKDVAIQVLSRARQRPNFGNAGEVENMISHAKGLQQARQSALPLSARSTDIVFEPQDFDANYDRSSRAAVNCRELFKDVLGCDDIVDKLEGFVRTVNIMRARNIDPREHIPFNFLFAGPPGTGKSTTARKMGQVFYDMGFLATPDVHECSATDMIAGFVGQTGQKTVKLMEKALGMVLFIDEAYRLGEGQFATEAINELVDSLTKPRFMGKIVVILAGYKDDMNNLLKVNQGLASRFPEEITFKNMEPEDSWKFLQRNLQKTGITIKQPESSTSMSEIMHLFQELTNLPSWGNGRDVQTISKTVTNAAFQSAGDPTAELSVSHQDIINALTAFLAKQRSRVTNNNPRRTGPNPGQFATQNKIDPPKVTRSSIVTTQKRDEAEPPVTEPEAPPLDTDPSPERDPNVTDTIWNQLQADKTAQERRQAQQKSFIAAAEAQAKKSADEAAALAKELAEQKAKAEKEAAELAQKIALENEKADKEAAEAAEKLAAQKVKERNDEMERIKRMLEAARIREETARRQKEEYERQKKQEAVAQARLRHMGICPAGFQWIKQAGGYRCSAGGHFVSDSQLGF